MTTLNDQKFNIQIVDLPDFDPQVTGALYNSEGDVRISATNNSTWLPAGAFIGAFTSATPFLARAGIGKEGDWGIDMVSKQMYAYDEDSGTFKPIGASEADVLAIVAGITEEGTTTLANTNAAIFADGAPGQFDPTLGKAGWHFTNTADVTNKINWYYLSTSNPARPITSANLDGQYALVEVRAGGAPYFVYYTAPTGDGNDAASWYRSRLVYAPTGYDLTAYIGQTIVLYWGTEPTSLGGFPTVECTLDTFSTVGPQGATENLLFGNLSTSSGYPAGTYDFLVKSLSYIADGNNMTYLTVAAPAGGGDAPATLDDAYVTLDGVNDFIELTGTGSVLDFSATWTIGLEIVELPSNTTDGSFMCIARSGNNGLSLRKGGSNWGFYAAVGSGSIAQANTWYAPSNGSRILIECDGTKIAYWLDGTRRSNTTMNATLKASSAHVVNQLSIGKGGIPFAQGTFQYAEGGYDNLLVSYSILSSAEKAEFFAGGDVTQHSYYGAARDAVPFGEGTYPSVTGEKGNVTGALVNGTSDDFVERT